MISQIVAPLVIPALGSFSLCWIAFRMFVVDISERNDVFSLLAESSASKRVPAWDNSGFITITIYIPYADASRGVAPDGAATTSAPVFTPKKLSIVEKTRQSGWLSEKIYLSTLPVWRTTYSSWLSEAASIRVRRSVPCCRRRRRRHRCADSVVQVSRESEGNINLIYANNLGEMVEWEPT